MDPRSFDMKTVVYSLLHMTREKKYKYLTVDRFHPALDRCAVVESLLPFAKMENCMFCQRRTT